MNEIDLTSVSSLEWIDSDTYCISIDTEPEIDSKGNSIHCWYEVEYHADQKKVVFVKTMEDTHGNCDSVNVEDVLSKEIKEAIISIIKDRIGDKLVLE